MKRTTSPIPFFFLWFTLLLCLLLLIPASTQAADIPFASIHTIFSTSANARAIFTADIDGDGDLDLLTGTYDDDTIAWYANLDGDGSFGTKQVISVLADGTSAVLAADIDGDGDLDVLSASENDDEIAWYANLGTGTFGAQQIITSLADVATDVFAADVDGDGDLDVLSGSFNDSKIAWYENTDGAGTFGAQQIISTLANRPEAVHAADIDGDGDVDVLSASLLDDEIAWYDNTSGDGSTWTQRVITNLADGAFDVFAADIDGDGDMDAVSAAFFGNEVAWYENVGGAGTSWTRRVLTSSATGAASVTAADADADGDMDILWTAPSATLLGWHENTDGVGTTWTQHTVAALSASAALAADVDRDGDLDVLAKTTTTVGWFENQSIHRSASFVSSGGKIGFDGSFFNSAVFAADLDGDGDPDAVAAAISGDEIAWYENTDGAGSFGPQQVISTLADDARSVYAADLDGDGDLDVLSASNLDDKIAWYENTDSAGSFGPQQVISTLADGPRSVIAADIDGDGDTDVLSASATDSKIAWYENTDGAGSFGPQQIISTLGLGAHSVHAADLDGDGDPDVLAASQSDDEIAWYENLDGAGSFGPQQVISTLADGARSVFAADLDGDGDLDVASASASDDKIAWYENTDGAGSFGAQRVISTLADEATSVFAVDVDGDGDLDILSSSELDDKVAWYANTDGAGSFGAQQVISTFGDEVRAVVAADFDGDGDPDVLAASIYGYEIAWYENLDGAGSFGIVGPRAITTLTDNARSVHAADLDGDGDSDVLSASHNDDEIAWYENTDGAGSFGPQQVISTLADGAQWVFAADLDGDGDSDVLSASLFDDKVAWYENTDGAGSFGPQQVISTLGNGAQSVFTADLDGDGDTDVLSATVHDDSIAWYENTNGAGSFGSRQVISTLTDAARLVFASDIDGDGDADVLSASELDDKIAWYENTDGAGSFGPQQVISTLADGARSVFAADLDGDGDPDVLSASNVDDKIAWYENTDGAGSFGPQQVISTIADGAMSIFATDLDGDGDSDVLSASVLDNKIAWYENTDGTGSFGPQQIISTFAAGVVSVSTADLDGDGNTDILLASSADDTIAWVKNEGGQFALDTRDIAPGFVFDDDEAAFLSITVTHEGVPGDADLELATLTLLFEEAIGDPLTTAEASTLAESVNVYRDDGSDVFERGSDTLVTIVSLALTDGLQVIPFANGDPDARVAQGAKVTFFVTVDSRAGASAASPRTMRIFHSVAASTAEHASTASALHQAHGRSAGAGPVVALNALLDEDSDGISNGDEVNVYGTDPLLADTDGDGLSDGAELTHGANPLLVDTDGDTLSDGWEIVLGTDPTLTDTDGDGLADNIERGLHGTDPLLTDTDGDGLSDPAELANPDTDPLLADTDGDTILDGAEVAGGTNPSLADTDADGVDDPSDNCPSAYNRDQSDDGGLDSILPDGVGNLCQNADFNGDGVVDILDVILLRRGLAELEPTLDPSMPPSP